MTAQAQLEQMLTIDQFCEWRGISRAAAAQERYRGDGPKFLKLGKQVRYLASDCQAWIEQNTKDRT